MLTELKEETILCSDNLSLPKILQEFALLIRLWNKCKSII